MRRTLVGAVALALAFFSAGCIIVLGGKDLPTAKHVVEIDGELYVVDAERHRLRKVEIEKHERHEDLGEPGD